MFAEAVVVRSLRLGLFSAEPASIAIDGKPTSYKSVAMACIKPPKKISAPTALQGPTGPRRVALDHATTLERQRNGTGAVFKEMDRAEQAISSATSAKDVADALRNAQDELDRARKNGLSKSEISRLEAKLSQLKKDADRKTAELADHFHQQSIRIVDTSEVLPFRDSRRQDQNKHGVPVYKTHNENINSSKEDKRSKGHAARQSPAQNNVRPIVRAAQHSRALEVTSADEAAQYAQDILGVQLADFENFDQQSANEVNAMLEVMQDKYPGFRPLSYLGTIQNRNLSIRIYDPLLAAKRRDIVKRLINRGIVATTLHSTEGRPYDGITFNETWVNNHKHSSERLQRWSKRSGSAPGVDSISGVTVHEFGHWVERNLDALGFYDGDLAKVVSRYQSKGSLWIWRNVSEYAMDGPDELFAEAFAEYHLSHEPRQAALEIGAAIDAAYQKMVNMK